MAKHELQTPIDELRIHFKDAMRLSLAVENSLRLLTEERRASGNSGSGAPPAWNSSLNRAVVVAAVGGLEAYMERLATVALDSVAEKPVSAEWVTITGSRGDLTTPSSRNIRKLFWMLFCFDISTDWDISVGVSNADLGQDGTWRVGRTSHSGDGAARFLDAMLQVRHGFAHQDATRPRTSQGMASINAQGEATVQSHHAYNAVSAALQIALQSTMRVSDELGFGSIKPNWPARLNTVVSSGVGADYWLVHTEIESTIRDRWKGSYPALPTGEDAETDDESPIGRLDDVVTDLPVVTSPDEE